MALTRCRRPCGRAHADACEGCHVAGRLAGGGPMGIVGPGNRRGGGNAIASQLCPAV